MPDLMKLSIPIVADPKAALAAFQQVNRAGQQAATQYTSAWKTATTAFQANAQRIGSSSLQVAGALQQVAAQGRLGTEQLKQFIAQGSQMLFMFGPYGAIVGALGVATSAIVTMFSKARTEAEKMRTEALAMIRQIRYETNLGPAYMRATQLEGQRAGVASQLTAARERLSGLLAEQALLSEPPGLALIARTTAAANEVRKLEQELSKLEEQTKAANETVASLSQSETRLITATDLVEKRTKAAADAAKTAVPAWQRLLNEIRQQVAMEERLARLRRSPFDIDVPTPSGAGAAGAAARGQAGIEREKAMMAAYAKDIDAFIESINKQMATGIAGAISGGISEGFAQAFSAGSIGKGLEALGRTLLSALGRLIQSIGEQMLAANLLMQKAMAFFGGPLGIAASVGLIALGGALGGLAMAGGGGGGRSIGSVGSSAGTRRVEDRSSVYTLNPQGSQFANMHPAAPVTVNATFLGEPTPRVERWIYDVVEKASRRGMGPPQTWRGR